MTRHYSGSQINGYRRKARTPDLELAPLRISSPVRNGQVNNNNIQRKITRVFAEFDEALINRRLPKELLLRIFSYLDVVSLCRCAQVSKAWNVLALDGSNWQEVDLFEFQVDIEGIVVENLAKRCGGFLKSLSLNGCQAVGDSALSTFARNCPNIEQLNLGSCSRLTDHTCQSLSRHCPKLRVMDISSCNNMTDNSLRAVGRGCPMLVSVNISWCEMMTAAGVAALAEGCRGLKTFIAKVCLTKYYHILSIFEGCRHVGDEALYQLVRRCTGLQLVNLQGCRHIQDDGVIELAENCPALHNLCISNCVHLSDMALLSLANNCKELVTLECAGVSQFTDAGFQALAKSCHNLSRMDLDECVLISDATLIVLAAQCPQLRSLSFSHCELITDEGIRHLGMSSAAKENLTMLELDNCPLITDHSLDHLMGCRNLQRIELYDCQSVTRAGIRRLRGKIPNIKVQAYFAPSTPPVPAVGGPRARYCPCCALL